MFESVARTGSPQRAAAEMNVSQPAISQAIKALELYLDAALLDRRTRPPSLTDAGRIMQDAVSDGLGRITEAIEQIRSLQRVNSGSVTIACSVGTATYWLMPRLTEFYAEHTDLSVNVMTTAQGAGVMAPGVDLAIRYGLGDWTDGTVIKLFEERVVPVCHPRLHQRMLENDLQLTDVTLLHVNSGEDNWMSWKDYLDRIGYPHPHISRRTFTNYVQATQAALGGQGIMLGWDSNTSELVRQGSLVALPFPPLQPLEAFYLVMPNGQEARPAVNALSEWLRRVVATNTDAPAGETPVG